MTRPDPFCHHPELRGRVLPAAESFFRDLDIDALHARVVAAGHPEDWRTPCAEREAGRQAFLDTCPAGDLWVFGYGSLMWDPSIEFTEVRRAHTDAFGRSFNLWDTGGRGTPDKPGLMLTMDRTDTGEAVIGCTGLAFRIAAGTRNHETFVLWRREMLVDAYRPVCLTLATDHGPVEAISFAANHASDYVVPAPPIAEQARMIATAEGMFGTGMDYLDNVHSHLGELKIADPYVTDLHARATAHREAAG